jgi:Ca2+-binding RTX toxin-like protein
MRFAAVLAVLITLAALAPTASATVTFQPAQPYEASSPWWSAVADLNGDGRLDVATASNNTNIVSALLGNGDGTLQAPRNTPAAPSNLNSIAAGDLNGDGKADVAVTVNGSPGTVRVYLSNGDGTFDGGTPYLVGNFPQDVVIAPMDANSSPDIAVANQTSHDVSVYLNSGTGTFVAAPGGPVLDPAGNDFLGIGAADFDGDGFTDLAAGGINGTTPGVFFFKGSATGAFSAPTPLGGNGAQKPVAADLNGDGRPDIAAGRSALGDVVIIKRTATGFDSPTTVDPDGPAGTNGRITVADLDGDGIPDLAVPNTGGGQANKVSILIGRGDATFETASHEPVGGFPRQVAAGDLNGDGNIDLVTSNSGTFNESVLLAIPPAVTFPALFGFGNQPLGTQSAEQALTVRNDGPPRLRPGAATLAGPDASQFSISSNTCTGANLAPGASCALGLRFSPNGLGARTAQLQLASNGAGAPHVVTLTGTGALRNGACANRRTGTARRDRLNGTPAGDRLFGLGGNDVLNGRAGVDCLKGGRGRDRLNGGTGKDLLLGDAGNDILIGGRGRNTYRGGAGNDTIRAANGVREKGVDCGPGRRDLAKVDRRDKVRRCERVIRVRKKGGA